MSKINIRTAKLEDIPKIKILKESIFGPFAKLEELYTRWITEDKFSVKIAVQDNKIVGICTWCIKEGVDFNRYESFGEKVMTYLEGKKAAWVLNLAVAPELRKTGLGKLLVLSHLEWLNSHESDIVCGCSWDNGTTDSSQKFFVKSGFQLIGESRDYMRTQMRHGAECERCQSADCKCNTFFYGVNTPVLIHLMREHTPI